MKIKNTSSFSTELIRTIVSFVRPAGISNFDVMVKNSERAFAGTAYYKGSGYHATASPFIVARVGAEKFFPMRTKAEKGYLPYLLLSREEALVAVLAHELRHLWQAKHSRGKVWGSKGKFSERDADAFAIYSVRKYRREVVNLGN